MRMLSFFIIHGIKVMSSVLTKRLTRDIVRGIMNGGGK